MMKKNIRKNNMAVLTTSKRKKIPKSEFGLPSEKKYPKEMTEERSIFNTGFAVLDIADIDAFLDVAFISLKREAKKTSYDRGGGGPPKDTLGVPPTRGRWGGAFAPPAPPRREFVQR